MIKIRGLSYQVLKNRYDDVREYKNKLIKENLDLSRELKRKDKYIKKLEDEIFGLRLLLSVKVDSINNK